MRKEMSIFIFLSLCFIITNLSKGESISLPRPETKGKISLEQLIKERRSVRNYSDRKLNIKQVSQLLWSAQGITDENENKRAVPSAGALYPLLVYVLVNEKGVSELPAGVYRYEPGEHKLVLIRKGDLSTNLASACLNQSFIASAPVKFIMVGDPTRTERKYKERAWLYIHLEAGMASQNLILQAQSLGLRSCPVGAFYERAIIDLIYAKEPLKPLLVIAVGYPAD